MSEKPLLLDTDRRFRDIVIESAGKEVFNCYQCNKCSAGCPVAFAMDLLPHQVIRSVLFGKKEKVMSSGTIWLCASCETCTTRCPNEIDIAQVMDVLRQLHYESGHETPQPKILYCTLLFSTVLKKPAGSMNLAWSETFQSKAAISRKSSKKVPGKTILNWQLRCFYGESLSFFPHGSKGVKDVRTLFNQAQEHKKV